MVKPAESVGAAHPRIKHDRRCRAVGRCGCVAPVVDAAIEIVEAYEKALARNQIITPNGVRWRVAYLRTLLTEPEAR